MNSQSTWANGRGRSTTWTAPGEPIVSQERRPFVYAALVAFAWLYYYRPEDFITPLAYIPMAKITGLFGFITLIFGMMSGGKIKIPRAIQFLWLLLFHMSLCVPLAIWPSGAFATIFEKFSKGVVVAMLISMAVVTVWELRRLLWIQVSAVALVTFISIAVHHHNPDGRLSGVQNSILQNPNDLAINIAISFPLCLAFMLGSRGIRKAIWGVGLAVMCLGVVLTYSRSGLLALIISIIVCVWEYGIKGKRRHIVVSAVLILVLGMGIALSSSHYRARVESIVLGNIEGSGDKGSLEARKALLKKSLLVALTHPLFGVGPGCFLLVDKGWVVAHNTYTELAAESGFPALILFLLAMRSAFKNIALVRKSQKYEEDPEFRLFTQALWAGLAAYLTGACFASTEYNLYPYFMVAYTCAMVRIINQPVPDKGQRREGMTLSKVPYDRIPRPQPLLGR
jgi:O-antigen ligase